MSKVNRRKEIKQKEELQARFQLAISQANSKVTNWLSPFNAQEAKGEQNDALENGSSFFDLPIIPNGAGLYSLDAKQATPAQHHTISDFISGEEKGLRQLKQQNDGSEGGARGQGNSRAMNALMNKMRNANRDRISKNAHTASSQGSSYGSGLHNKSRATSNFMKEIKKNKDEDTKALNQAKESDDDDDDDEDDGVSRFKNRSVKKGASDMFGANKGKKKSSKGRPF